MPNETPIVDFFADVFETLEPDEIIENVDELLKSVFAYEANGDDLLL